ncbi:hypothetical protein HMPREF1127_1337 [Fusobacterium necrophorum subsp. funduliforme Fnf 1007]|uniref:Uncharacterized protein n=1 Tax=Fusobacterium necrophorum subsp. funduliforme Fnf 1007 TaxID=1161424 RepID=A0AAN3VWU4_9FUSO|nr:hypothetical protein HMPREF1127_1337 [Fusobacterium necrophorum subsp. funduliforme Fnf 1007]
MNKYFLSFRIYISPNFYNFIASFIFLKNKIDFFLDLSEEKVLLFI